MQINLPPATCPPPPCIKGQEPQWNGTEEWQAQRVIRWKMDSEDHGVEFPAKKFS
jgi:hypothetical protein